MARLLEYPNFLSSSSHAVMGPLYAMLSFHIQLSLQECLN